MVFEPKFKQTRCIFEICINVFLGWHGKIKFKYVYFKMKII